MEIVGSATGSEASAADRIVALHVFLYQIVEYLRRFAPRRRCIADQANGWPPGKPESAKFTATTRPGKLM
jgi:hypothetical protein